MSNELKGFRVAVLVTDGVEEVELTEPVKALRENGADVEIISPHSGEIQGFKHHEKAGRIKVDRTLDSVRAADYEGLLLPGGAFNADAMRVEPLAIQFVRQMNEAGKPIAAICHAPWILVSAGVVNDRIITSYYTIQDDLKNAGAQWVDQQVVVDQNWVSSRQPKDIPAFNREMIKLFSKSHASIIDIAESA
jgi:protease I